MTERFVATLGGTQVTTAPRRKYASLATRRFPSIHKKLWRHLTPDTPGKRLLLTTTSLR